MCTSTELKIIIQQLVRSVRELFPQETPEVILFGSYARNDADDGSDIDVLLLMDASREEIAEKNWQVGEVAAELLLAHGIVVSPILENRDYYFTNMMLLPFFQNIQREGVRMSA